jgi:hypothetical protein
MTINPALVWQRGTQATPPSALCQPVFPPSDCCVKVPASIVHDPDPETYTQSLVAAGGALPTFRSPDMDSVDIWPWRPLNPIPATVRNLSSQASANQTRVDFLWSPWGVGMPRTNFGTTFVDLPRAGFPDSQQTITMPLPADAIATGGFYGIFVQLSHPYDSNTRNDFGEHTINGFTTDSGRSHNFELPVRNPTGATQTVTFTVGPPAVAAWVTIAPSTFTLAPGAQQTVNVQVAVPTSVPVSPAGTAISYTIDIMATLGGAYLGGVSILILVDK